MKVRNRILNIFLAVMLVFTTLLSTNKEVFAATEPSAIDVQNEGNGIAEVKDNEGNMLYKLTKTIEEKDYVSKKATVTIGAEGGSVKSTESTKKKIDIVFLVDTSGSMKFGLDGTQNNVPYKNQRISKLKEALKNSFYLVQLLVKEKNLQGDIRVGLVSFAGESRPVTGLKKVVTDTNPPYDSVNATGWGSSVESLVAEGGTYTDKALSEVSAMFDNNDNKRIVVLMTDGKPTFSTEIKNYSNYEFNDTVTRGDGRNFELIPIMEPAHHINKAEWIEGYFRNCQVPEYWKRKNFWGKLKDKVDSHYVGESWEYIKGYFRNCDLPEYRRPEKNKEEGYFTGDYINVKDNGVAGILRAQMLKDNNTSIYTMGIGANEEELKTYLQALASEPDMFYPDSSANMSNFTQNLKNILYKEISNPTISDETLTDIMGEKVNLISNLDDIKNSINVSVKNNDSEIAAKRKVEIKKAIEDNLKINNDTITIDKITLAEGESFTIKYDIEPDVDKLAETDYGKWLDANQSATLGQKVFPKPQIKVFMPELEIIKLDAENNKELENAEFSLYKNGNLFVPYKMIQNGYVNINGKIVTDSSGTVRVNIPYGQYELKETKAPDGYLINKEAISLNVNDIEIIQEVRNTAIQKVTYGAHKTWQYVNENELNSYEVEVGLYEEGKTNEPAIDTITLKGNETKPFKEVPKVTQDNKEIKYVVKEIKVTKDGADFTYEQVGNAELNGNNVFELVNKPSDNNIQKVQYGAHKTWQYVNVGELKNYEVQVGLYEEGKTNEPAIDTITLKGNETKPFKEVPKVTQDNKEIKYVVKEIKVTKGGADFTYEQVGNAELNGNNVFELVNKPSDNNIQKVQYGAHKTWQYVNENELNSYEVEVGLYEEGKTNEPAIDTIILKGNETKQFKEVPKVTQDNKEIKYVVKEIKVTKGGADFTYEQVGNAELNGNNVFELVNKPSDNNIQKVQYGAHKTWQYVNENELNSYEVEVGLYEEGKTNEPAIDTITLKGNETKPFKEVPKVTQDNKEIKYVVKEIKVTKGGADFAYEQVGNAELNGNNVFELVNKPSDNNIPKVIYGAHKTWQYVNENELNSYEVEVGLYEEGKTNEPAIDTITLKGNETKPFKEVPKVTQDNKEIKYVVKEIKVTKDGADFAYEQVGDAELNLTSNTFELVNKPKDPNKLTIKVTKEWLGVEDPSNLTAKIHLLENEDPTDNKVVTGNNSVTFEVDKFDSDGNPLTLDQIKAKYTISETNIPEGYKLDSVSEPSMDENGVVNYTVKNIVDGTVYRTLVAEKQWLNRDASPMSNEDAAKYQVKITVSKLVDGNITPLLDEEVKGDLTITGNGEIKFKVPAKDDKGDFIKYYLSEKVIGQVSYIQRTEDIKDPENKDQIQGLYGVKFINQLQDLTIKKLDGSNNNQALQGIDFTIVKDNDMISGTTNSDGVLVSNDSRVENGKISLSEGDYTVSETNAESMGYKATTPVTLRVTTDSILIVNKDENGNEIRTTLLPNGVLKITDYLLGSENDPKVEPEDKQDDPTPVPDPDPNPNQPGGDQPGGNNPGGNNPGGNNPGGNNPGSPGGDDDNSGSGGNSGGGDSGDRDRDNEPRRPRTTSDTVTVNDDATPLSVPDTGNNGDADTVTVDEETTPLSAANTNGDELEIAEDEVPLSLPKTGSQDNMLYVILGMAMAIFGIKKFRK